MSWLAQVLKTSIGGKLVMAITGVLLSLFLVGHLAGNLLLFRGRAAVNDYAEFLKASPALLWAVRLGLLAVFLLHVITALRLAAANRAARPVRYAKEYTNVATQASRTMVLTGLLVLAYLLFHLAHFTVGITHPEHHALREAVVRGGVATTRHDVFSMMVKGFQQPLVSGLYAAAMVLLGVHLSHGVSSVFQTLGLNHPRYNPILRRVGPVFAILIAAGFLTLPAAVLFGFVQLPAGVQ